MTYEHCELCPRRCGANRCGANRCGANRCGANRIGINRSKTVGRCGQTNEIRVARAALHMWEEPCLSGSEGSGTVFFCGCTLGCVYCQNAAISRENCVAHGKIVTVERLAEIFLNLAAQGANNINLVTPTMFAPSIAAAIDRARAMGLTLPIVYNTSGYERLETLQMLAGKIDVYLPDFKYISPDLAARYSHAADYPNAAKAALAEMVRQCGEFAYDARGMMKRGVIVRHLLLPGQLAESKRTLDYLWQTYGNSIVYSLMSQYTPLPTLDASRYPELNRRVTTYEYHKLIDYAAALGITNGFVQDGRSAKESFIPAFNGEGV